MLHVLSGMSWFQCDVESKPTADGRLQPWYSLEFVRPNVRLSLTETGETLHSALNLLPQVSHVTLLETSGLQNVGYASLRRWVQRERADGGDPRGIDNRVGTGAANQCQTLRQSHPEID